MAIAFNFLRNAGVLGVALTAAAMPAAAQNSVITGARMLDVLTGKIVEHPAIFVGEDGRITSIADARVVRWTSDTKHIDLGDRTLLPGLIDMHVHLDSPADIGGYRGLEFTDSFWGMTAVGNARAMLDAGFTTVRNVGSDNRNDVGLKQAIDNGYAVGPRVVPLAMHWAQPAGIATQRFCRPAWKDRRKKRVLPTALMSCAIRCVVSANMDRK